MAPRYLQVAVKACDLVPAVRLSGFEAAHEIPTVAVLAVLDSGDGPGALVAVSLRRVDCTKRRATQGELSFFKFGNVEGDSSMNDSERRRNLETVDQSDCAELAARFLKQHAMEIRETLADLNRLMFDEHKRELRDCRKRSKGEMPKLAHIDKVYHDEDQVRTRAEPVWFTRSNNEDTFDRTCVYYTGQIIRRLKCGDYCRKDFERALPKLARWEIRLVWEYERRAQLLREYMRNLEKIVCDLLDLPDVPSIYELRDMGDLGLPPSELDW